ncbi:MAG TPA: hypothetical protein VL625_01355, partial [Patescibacteria group bacterium]|nr:hypothetical protein [Patescibacteria group bacterium]
MQNARLLVDFNSRSLADQAHGTTRPYPDEAATQDPRGYTQEFYQDLQHIADSQAFRRLKDIFQFRPGTHHQVQNRLTHTIVASNVGETLCRNLGLGQESIDLVKAIVYAHDIGHPALCHRG